MIRKPGVDMMADTSERVHENAEKHASEAPHHEDNTRKLEAKIKKFEIMSVVFAVIILVLAVAVLRPQPAAPSKTSSTSVPTTSISPTPEMSVGQSLAGIDTQLNSSELAAINNAPNSYFETAGNMMLNLSLPGEMINQTIGAYVGVVYLYKQPQVQPFVVNGKPSVIYLGAISCIYCAENRWAMAMALSRFGNFSALYKGYSSLKDGDVPTLYWAQENITGSGSASFKNYYTSNYINFFSAEYDSNISSGFQLPRSGLSYFIQNATDQNDRAAMGYIGNAIQFKGTPTTVFGTSVNGGVDAVVFGVPNSTTEAADLPPLTYMTHADILGQLKNFNTALSVQEYAGADVYVAQICRGINNTAPVCSLKAIASMEGVLNEGIS
jgi:hypothetical protein